MESIERDIIMKNRNLLPLCLCAALVLTGCGRNAAAGDYHGKFDEAVFDQICQDVIIAGRQVTLPCTLSDLGDGFKAEFRDISADHKTVSYTLSYEAQDLGVIYFCGSSELEGDALAQTEIAGLYLSRDPKRTVEVSVGGISPGAPVSQLEKQFGKPTQQTDKIKTELNTTFQTYQYLVGDADPEKFGGQKLLDFAMINDEVFGMTIEVPTTDNSQD